MRVSATALSRRRALPVLAGAAAGGVLAACQPARLVRRDPSRRLVLRINMYGSAAYAPLLLMRERQLLERALPGLSVEWKVIPPAREVNQALSDGGLDIATGPPTAFLLAREAGIPARIVGGVAALPCAVVGRSGLRSLGALRRADQVAVPEEASLESAVLQLAALRELGDARALDANMVARPSADVLPLLKQPAEKPASAVTPQVTAPEKPASRLMAQVAVTPILDLLLEGTGPERLVDSRDLFGGLPTAALAYALPSLREHTMPLLATFTEALEQATRLAAGDPLSSARLLNDLEELRLPPDRIGELLARSGWQPGVRVAGVTRIADLWRHTDRLKRTPAAWSELAFPGVQGD